MDFVKMHGLGNDFILLDRRAAPATITPELVRALCDRRRGLGADGVIVLEPGRSGVAATMRIHNRDGTDGAVCGNGLRCVASWLFRTDGTSTTAIGIPGGEAEARRVSPVDPAADPASDLVEVVLPGPDRRLSSLPAAIPGRTPEDDVVDVPVQEVGLVDVGLPSDARMTLVSTGCPHAVFLTARADEVDLRTLGPALGDHAWFPGGVNVHLVRRSEPGRLEMRTWERGAGPTPACGTGACAAVAADRWSGRDPAPDGFTRVGMIGGDLWIGFDLRTEEKIRMRGPAVEVARGVLSSTWIAESSSESSP